MRNTKFRAWNRDKDRMEYNSHSVELFPFMGCVERLTDVIVRPAIHNTRLGLPFNGDVMQFTGLVDKNEKEIYEGDIVAYKEPHNGISNHEVKYFEEYGLYGMAETRWGKNGAPVGRVGSSTRYEPYILTKHHTNKMEVIGNIYENPDLLK